MKHLTVLSFGGGQDSTAILLLMIFCPGIRKRYAPGRLLVVMSDTGNEHGYTYSHVDKMMKLCQQFDIEFHFLTPDMGYHTPAWQNIVDPQCREEGSKFKETMVQLKTKSCTDKVKIGPIYKFLDAWINKEMGYDFKVYQEGGCKKQAMKKFHAENGRIKILIGFAQGEEGRAEKSDKLQANEWAGKGRHAWGKYIERFYPLIDLGMNRQACQDYINEKLGYCPMPSNCKLCPYQADPELLLLYKLDRPSYDTWVGIEERKLKRDQAKEKNYGIFASKRTLPERMEKILEKYSDWTIDQLVEYKMSHGCQSNAM